MNLDIYKKYKRFEITEKSSFNKFCYPSKYKHQKPQLFVGEFMGPDTENKNLLVYHKIGSGKTCASIRIAEKWKKKRNIIVVVPASLKNNYRHELRSLCADNEYISAKNRQKLTTLDPTSDEYLDIIDESNKKIDKYYNIMSYNKFMSNTPKLNNSVLIIDEIQNLISDTGSYYTKLYNTIMNAPKDLRLVLLSATPMFDKPHEIALTLNLLRLKEPLPIGAEFYKTFVDDEHNLINHDIFRQSISGCISYYAGAPSFTYPETTIKYIKCEMSNFQYSAYKKITGENVEFSNSNIYDLPNDFYLGPRLVSNFAFPNGKSKESGLKSLTEKIINTNLESYSTKLDKLIKKIKSCKGKIFIYSGFKGCGGLKTIAYVLDVLGYKSYIEHGEGKKRYAIWSGDEDIVLKDEIKTIYNNSNNLYGDKLKILLLSPSAKEGLSLFAVRQAHIFEPYWNLSRIQQILGRGSRYCSHKELPKEERNIKVYIYQSTRNDIYTIDKYMKDIADKKYNLVKQFEDELKKNAIDCRLNKLSNGVKCI